MSCAIFSSPETWKIYGEYDVVVCGAGTGGIGAAIAAARAGKKTIIIDQAGYPGGTLTRSLVPHIMGMAIDHKQISGGIADEICRKLEKAGKAKFNVDDPIGSDNAFIGDKEIFRDVMTDTHSFIILANDLLEDSGAERLFYTTIIGAVTKKNKIESIAVNCLEGQFLIKGKTFIDATADANVINFAGGETRKAAPDESMTKTMIFEMDHTQFDRETVQKAFYEEVKMKTIPIKAQDRFMGKTMYDTDQIHLNLTAVTGDAINSKDMTRMDMELRQQIEDGVKWYKKYIPGFENGRLTRYPAAVGVRAGRNAVGIETITMEDILENIEVKEPICMGIRRNGDHGTEKFVASWQKNVHGVRAIPMKTIISRNFDNVLMAGRSISCEQKMVTCIRYNAVSLCCGQAAGNLASISVEMNLPAKNVPYEILKEKLLDQNAILGPSW
jgi:hypothetical protein